MSDAENTKTDKSLDCYTVARETRNFEISLFWQRSNYFLALNTAIAIGFFSTGHVIFNVILCGLGVAVSFLWVRVNLGSKYWQSRWEYKLRELEKNYNLSSKLFSATGEEMDDDVRKELKYDTSKGWRQTLNRWIMLKPSVSRCMILLSMIFFILWCILLLITLICCILRII